MIPLIIIASVVASVSCNCNNGPDRARNVFHAYDADNDGRISRAEGLRVFRISDEDSNGLISPSEFSTEWTFYNNAGLMPFFQSADDNKDGFVDTDEGFKGFDFFDNDEDGYITWIEFSKTWTYLTNYYATGKESNSFNLIKWRLTPMK